MRIFSTDAKQLQGIPVSPKAGSRNLIKAYAAVRLLTWTLAGCLSLICGDLMAQRTEGEIVNDLHKRKFKWLEANNTDSLNWLLADEVSYVHSNGWIQNRAEVLSDMKTGKLKYKSVAVESSTISITDNTALVVGTGVFTGEVSGTAFSLKLLYTEVYVKTQGRWRLAGRHSCKMP